ncbi:permease for cytosine/purines, uracil, thiamine, allantoin-domain-containing protein, partial [Mycena latifolia]
PLCMLPWNLLKSSNSFTSYLSAYLVFLSSIAVSMITEYYVVRKGHYRVAGLKHARRDEWYWYRTPTASTSGPPYIANIAGILINIVGFARATGRTVPCAATPIY